MGNHLVRTAGKRLVICIMLVAGFAAPASAGKFGKANLEESPYGTPVTSAPDIRIADNWDEKTEVIDVGAAFTYGSSNGRVEVKCKGTSAGFGLRLAPNVEIGYAHINYNVDSYLGGPQVGAVGLRSNLFSIKIIGDADKPLTPGLIKLGAEYRLLTESGYPDISFLYLFAGANLGTTHITTGLTGYYGRSMKNTEYGVFLNATWILSDEAEVFFEYSTPDFLKVYQKQYVTAASRNIGPINTGAVSEDAMSFGLRLIVTPGLSGYFKLYDLDSQMRPVLGVAASY